MIGWLMGFGCGALVVWFVVDTLDDVRQDREWERRQAKHRERLRRKDDD